MAGETNKYYWATGRRKTAVAVVKISKGKGEISINGQKVPDSAIFISPFQLTSTTGKFDVLARVRGGGKVSQNDAVRLGVSRALVKSDQEFRLSLKKSGLLTRDPREKERKKYGLKRARKAPQWSKR